MILGYIPAQLDFNEDILRDILEKEHLFYIYSLWSSKGIVVSMTLTWKAVASSENYFYLFIYFVLV